MYHVYRILIVVVDSSFKILETLKNDETIYIKILVFIIKKFYYYYFLLLFFFCLLVFNCYHLQYHLHLILTFKNSM